MAEVTIQHDQKIAFSAFVCPYPKGCKARKRAGSLQGWGKTGRFLLVFPSMLNSYWLNSSHKCNESKNECFILTQAQLAVGAIA